MKHRGFTLIELLVVVAIIALLIALLLPSLAAARHQAKTVTCSANMRSIGIMFAMYAGEYGRYPIATTTFANYPGDGPGADWAGELLAAGLIQEYFQVSLAPSGIGVFAWQNPAPNFHTPKLFCPEYDSFGPISDASWSTAGYFRIFSYGMPCTNGISTAAVGGMPIGGNTVGNYTSGTPFVWVRPQQVVQPGDTVGLYENVNTDTNEQRAYTYTTSAWWDYNWGSKILQAVHQKRSNYWYVDGHVEPQPKGYMNDGNGGQVGRQWVCSIFHP